MRRVRIDSAGCQVTMNGEEKLCVDFHAKGYLKATIALVRVPSDTAPAGAFHTLDLSHEGGAITLYLNEIQLDEIADAITDRERL